MLAIKCEAVSKRTRVRDKFNDTERRKKKRYKISRCPRNYFEDNIQKISLRSETETQKIMEHLIKCRWVWSCEYAPAYNNGLDIEYVADHEDEYKKHVMETCDECQVSS